MSRHQHALKFLATARQADIDLEAGGVYLIALRDIDPSALEAACRRLAQQSRKDYEPAMPTVGAIRALAEQLAREAEDAAHLKRLPPPTRDDEDGPRYACPDCQDGEWGPAMWCPGSGAERATTKHERHAKLETVNCGRPKPHAAHTFVQRCHCWGRNPNVERKRRERTAKTEAAA